ncbi:MAG: hypothetical protein R3E60_03000 [Alphaproteobacteria bacterium]
MADAMDVCSEWPATYGLAFHDGYLYADASCLARSLSCERYTPTVTEGASWRSSGPLDPQFSHSSRWNQFYVGIGSRGNIDEESEPRATIRNSPSIKMELHQIPNPYGPLLHASPMLLVFVRP